MQGGAENVGPSWEPDEEDEFSGYTAAYCKLANASQPDRPVLAEITDPKQYVESSLQQFVQQPPQSAGAAGLFRADSTFSNHL